MRTKAYIALKAKVNVFRQTIEILTQKNEYERILKWGENNV